MEDKTAESSLEVIADFFLGSRKFTVSVKEYLFEHFGLLALLAEAFRVGQFDAKMICSLAPSEFQPGGACDNISDLFELMEFLSKIAEEQCLAFPNLTTGDNRQKRVQAQISDGRIKYQLPGELPKGLFKMPIFQAIAKVLDGGNHFAAQKVVEAYFEERSQKVAAVEIGRITGIEISQVSIGRILNLLNVPSIRGKKTAKKLRRPRKNLTEEFVEIGLGDDKMIFIPGRLYPSKYFRLLCVGIAERKRVSKVTPGMVTKIVKKIYDKTDHNGFPSQGQTANELNKLFMNDSSLFLDHSAVSHLMKKLEMNVRKAGVGGRHPMEYYLKKNK